MKTTRETAYLNLTSKQVLDLLMAFTGVGQLPEFLQGQMVKTGGRRIMDFNQQEFVVSMVKSSNNLQEILKDMSAFELSLMSGISIRGWRLSPYTGFNCSIRWFSKSEEVEQEFALAA